MSYAPLDPKNTVMLFADLQVGIIELTCTNANTDQESPLRDARKVHRREPVSYTHLTLPTICSV